MSGGGGKGGSQTSTQSVPDWVEAPARRNLARAEEISQIGYVPHYGPDVAAFTPQQQAAFANTNSAADAFGLQGGALSMPTPVETYANGVQGYSSAPIFEASVDELAARRPGQYDAINAQFIDPFTGASPTAQTAATTAAQPIMFNGGNGFHDDVAQSAWEASNRGGGMFDSAFQGGIGGYSGFGDMFDGGGPGASGGAFQGGGRISQIGNMATGQGGGNSSGGGNK